MKEVFQNWSVEKVTEFFHKELGVSPDLFLNILVTLFILVFLIFGREFLTKKFTQKISSQKVRKLIDDTLPYTFKLAGIALLIQTWITGTFSLTSLLGLKSSVIEQIASSIYVLLFYNGAKHVGVSLIEFRKLEDVQKEYSLTRNLQIILATIAGIFLFKVWIATEADLSTYLGLLSAGIAIALRDVVVSAAAGLYLVVVKPFSIGDRIEINGKLGDVIDIQPLQFSIMELGNWTKSGLTTGRVMHFPNHYVLQHPIANHNEGFNFVWHEMPVMVTFESDWQKAYEVLDQILEEKIGRHNEEANRQIRRASTQFKLIFPHLDSKVWVTVDDSGVTLTLRFLVEPSKRRIVESQIWQEILKAFAEHGDIDFAYPSQRTFLNFIESDQKLRPDDYKGLLKSESQPHTP